ncbi:response regulator transcription factor [Treponema sp.]|uniref:response regulator transcription factor n=1 Tax=Treponema sp. TaxID=166 RepID=UPI001E06EC64|nr:response regulator transcription factor [Treponema sp.]MBS7241033.1 response regulator transcription factor [Treponema sp.]MCI6442865.1 response regulator transcription factor [Spirochaetia bacterium]MDY4132294.1 response regulator transcription factor [Treponema sp.]
MRVLFIDDDVRSSQTVSELLKKNRFGVDKSFSGEEGFKYALSGNHDIIILENKLPDMDGMSLVQKIRNAGIGVPVMFLSEKVESKDIVGGLYAGADDYLTKPYNPDEFIARVYALTRRKGEIRSEKMTFGDFVLNKSSCEIQNASGESVKLSLKELLIATLLFENPRQIIRKEEIIDKIWGGDSDAEYNNVEVYISFLRKKMEQLKVHVVIRTARGLGYSLEETN